MNKSITDFSFFFQKYQLNCKQYRLKSGNNLSRIKILCFQVLMNPSHKDLKDFIVLRMGAFHTSCIFIAVIGKRFHDAGLRDWIIESDLLGMP